MIFWLPFLFFIATTVISELLRPKPKFDRPRPSALGDFQIPTADEDRCIPVPSGRCLVKGVNCFWYGNLKVVPMKKKVKTGMFSSEKIITGYKYYIGMALAIGHGELEGIPEVRFGDKVSTPVVTDGGDHDIFTFNDEKLFGGTGTGGEGGVKGVMDVYYGDSVQVGNAYMAGVLGKPMPGLRTLAYVVLNQMYIGTSQYIKQISFVVDRYPNTLGVTGGKHKIGDDVNPICDMYDKLTNTLWGIGFTGGNINTASFIAAAETCYDEGLGISFLMDNPNQGEEWIREILRHVDGVFYSDPSTAELVVKLARPDYDPDDLVHFTPDNADDCEFSRGSWEETINTVRVKYTDRAANFTERFVPVQNRANIETRGGWIEAEDYDFTMFSNATISNLVALRVLNTVSYPLAKLELMVDRRAYNLRPGSPIKVSWQWEEQSISNLVCRVLSIDYGQIRQGKITLNVCEDIFHLVYAAYGAPPDSEWVKPSFEAQLPPASLLWEVPLGLAELTTGQQVATIAAAPNGVHTSYDVLSDETGTATTEDQFELTALETSFTPTALLVGALAKDRPYSGETITVDNATDMGEVISHVVEDLSTEAVNLIMIEDEILFFEDLINNGDGSFDLTGVRSGMMYSIPQDHADNSRVWFITYGIGLVKDGVYPVDTDLRVRLLTKTITDQLEFSESANLDHTVIGVINGPYPPRDPKINGSRLFDLDTTVGLLAITWKGSSLTQSLAVDQDDAHVPPTSGTGFSLILRRADTLAAVRTVTRVPAGGSGGAYNAYGYVVETAPNVPLADYLLELWSERGGQLSQLWSHPFSIKGYGFDYGGTDSESPTAIGYGGSITPGEIAVRGAPPPVIEALPGLSLNLVVVIKFSGEIPPPATRSDVFTFLVQLQPFDGSPPHTEKYVLDTMDATSFDQLTTILGDMILADFPEFTVINNGDTLIISTFQGTPFVQALNDTSFFNFNVEQAAAPITNGTTHIQTYDVYEMGRDAFGEVEVVGPLVSTKYAGGGDIVVRLLVSGLTFETRQQLGVGGSKEFAVVASYPNFGPGASAGYHTGLGANDGEDLEAVLKAQSALAPYVQDISFTTPWAPSVTFPAPRSGVVVTMKQNYRLSEDHYENTPSNVALGMEPLKVLGKTNRQGLPFYPDGARKIVRVTFTSSWDSDTNALFEHLVVGQRYSVTLDGVKYETTVNATDVTDAGNNAYRDGIYNRLKTLIEADGYIVTFQTYLRQAGDPATFIASMLIQGAAVNVDYSFEMAAAFYIKVNITRS